MFDRELDGRVAYAEISVYDAQLSEMLCDHMTEKCRVRNRRKADRKHKELPEQRKRREEMRKDRMYGYYFNENCPKVMFHPDSLPIKYRKYAESNRIDRSDWELDLDNLAYEIGYETYEAETCRDDIREMDAEIKSIEYELSGVEFLRERLAHLRKQRDEWEKYLRRSENFLQEYQWAKELIK